MLSCCHSRSSTNEAGMCFPDLIFPDAGAWNCTGWHVHQGLLWQPLPPTNLPSGNIAVDNHHFLWENPLYMVIFNSYVKLPEGKRLSVQLPGMDASWLIGPPDVAKANLLPCCTATYYP